MNLAALVVLRMNELTDIERRLAALEKRLTALEERDAAQLKCIEDKLDAIISFFGIDKKRYAPCQIEQMASNDLREFMRREHEKKIRKERGTKQALRGKGRG